jgi:hypothetical protein
MHLRAPPQLADTGAYQFPRSANAGAVHGTLHGVLGRLARVAPIGLAAAPGNPPMPEPAAMPPGSAMYGSAPAIFPAMVSAG